MAASSPALTRAMSAASSTAVDPTCPLSCTRALLGLTSGSSARSPNRISPAIRRSRSGPSVERWVNPEPFLEDFMLSRSIAAKTAAALLVVGLGATACGGSSGGTASPQAQPSSSMSDMQSSAPASSTDATATQAAALRSGLDQLFREHVNLTGFVVQTAVISGVSSSQTTAAL